ncbi:MAG TPA: hypothetical protein VJB68_04860 [Methylophilaceae bacterium]|nr:hypothetical protein [Methylophilaceae bacterium]
MATIAAGAITIGPVAKDVTPEVCPAAFAATVEATVTGAAAEALAAVACVPVWACAVVCACANGAAVCAPVFVAIGAPVDVWYTPPG